MQSRTYKQRYYRPLAEERKVIAALLPLRNDNTFSACAARAWIRFSIKQARGQSATLPLCPLSMIAPYIPFTPLTRRKA